MVIPGRKGPVILIALIICSHTTQIKKKKISEQQVDTKQRLSYLLYNCQLCEKKQELVKCMSNFIRFHKSFKINVQKVYIYLKNRGETAAALSGHHMHSMQGLLMPAQTDFVSSLC